MNEKKYIDLDKAVDIGYLGDWYQSSIDTTVPPVWTDEHLEELCKDFIVIPKDTALANAEEVRCGKWIKKEHWVPLPRDYEVSYDSDYDDCYDEKTHSWKEKYWHCSCCDYEASRSMKPVHKYCPNCGAKMDKEYEW